MSNNQTESNSLTNITFNVHCHPLKDGEKLFITGSCPSLGNWHISDAVEMQKGILNETTSDENVNWQVTVQVPIEGGELKYKYFVMREGEVEPLFFEKHRHVTPKGHEMIIDDGGLFGAASDQTKHSIASDEGWIASGVQLRVFMGIPSEGQYPFVKLNDNTLNYKMEVINIESGRPFCFRSDSSFSLHASDKKALSFSVNIMNLFGKLFGKAIIHYSELDMRGKVIGSIINDRMELIGTVEIEYLVVTPFEHPMNNLNAIWEKQFTFQYIGHRGSGASAVRTQTATENTLLSFVTAAKLGANYIEFDVQLTKDNVPIICHDEEIWINTQSSDEDQVTLKVPINKLRFEKLRTLRPIIMKKTEKNVTQRKVTLDDSGNMKRSHSNPEIAPKKQSIVERAEKLSVEIGGVQAQRNYWEMLDTYPSLEEVLKHVPKEVGFNVEIKYPDNSQLEQYYAIKERNDYVNTILKVLFDFANDRKIMISSFDPDICLLCNVKQLKFPVFFLSEAGSETFSDARKNSLENAFLFAKASRLAGIVSHCSAVLNDLNWVKRIHDAGMLIFTWGRENNLRMNVKKQRLAGVDAVIADNAVHIKQMAATEYTYPTHNPYVGMFLHKMKSSLKPKVPSQVNKT